MSHAATFLATTLSAASLLLATPTGAASMVFAPIDFEQTKTCETVDATAGTATAVSSFDQIETRETANSVASTAIAVPGDEAIDGLLGMLLKTAHAAPRVAIDSWVSLRSYVPSTRHSHIDARLARAEPVYFAWQHFLDNLPSQDQRITAEHVDSLRNVLLLVADGERRMPAATTEVNDDSSLFLAWSTHGYYLDLTIYPDQRFTWFSRDRNAGTHAGSKGVLAEQVSAELRQTLERFLS